jgi:hypothetical protein
MGTRACGPLLAAKAAERGSAYLLDVRHLAESNASQAFVKGFFKNRLARYTPALF